MFATNQPRSCAGEAIGSYRIVSLIGRGGMGASTLQTVLTARFNSEWP